jgi:hypothetical protein
MRQADFLRGLVGALDVEMAIRAERLRSSVVNELHTDDAARQMDWGDFVFHG